MLKGMVKKIVGSRHGREIKRLGPLVDEINDRFAELEGLSDDQIKGKTDEFRARLGKKTESIQSEIASLKDQKRKSEDADDREVLGLEISKLEAGLPDFSRRGVGGDPARGLRGSERGVSQVGRAGDDGRRNQADMGHGPVRRPAGGRDSAPPRTGGGDGYG